MPDKKPESIATITASLTKTGELFEIEELQIRGSSTKVWKLAPPSLAAVLEGSRGHSDKTFLVYEDERMTFEQHFRRAARMGHWLVDKCGLKKGERVAIAMRNYPEWSIVFWGAAAAGAVVVPLNAWWTGEELEYGLADSGAKIVFADSRRAAALNQYRDSLGLKHIVVARPEDDDSIGDHIDIAHILAGADDDETTTTLPQVAIDPDDNATIFYTSGTTGRPKGALGTHRNICGNLLSLAFCQARGSLRSGLEFPPPAGSPQNAQLLSVPLFHATGCHSILSASLAFGGKLVMMHKWEPGRALELIERERCTAFGGVPAMVWQVLEHPDFSKYDLSTIKGVGYGGAPAAPELVRRISEAFPVASPSNGYGLTETSSVTTLNNGDDYKSKPDSVGVAIPVCDLKLVDPQGAPTPKGEVGELWIKGPNVVAGYWGKPDATAESFSDGWLHSGDLARIDEEGFVYIVDRAKDMLIRGGENVYCVEVESVLFDHPDVVDAAVVGLAHKVLGEEVGAVVQLRDGAVVDAEELKKHVASRLAQFKVPVRIDFTDTPLPRNAAGKILKRDLRQQMEET